MKWIYSFILLTSLAHAQTDNDASHRPPSFAHSDDKAVFADFIEATYSISYDLPSKAASVKTIIKLNVVEAGYPIFDLIAEPTLVKIDGEEVKTATVATPKRETSVRVIGKKLAVGTYELEVNSPLSTLVSYTGTGVKSAFWVTDLEDRFYLERYIPTNLEYDRYKMTFLVNFQGVTDQQHIFANGKVTWTDAQNARVEYPDYFTVNSLYFHTTPVGSVELTQYDFTSKSGRLIPVSIYTAKGLGAGTTLSRLQAKTTSTLNELESDYGAFRHDSVTIYNADLSSMGLGGMEYAGATVTNLGSLSHELFHSYFARGVVPANGSAGWIDESLASWRDNGYDRSATLRGSSQMASHGLYTRKTDTQAYTFGARFMAFLDSKLSAKGGLKPFMNRLLEDKLFTPIFTEEFVAEMEKFYGEELMPVFKTYVYGSKQEDKGAVKGHPIHRKMGAKELESIL